MRAIAATGSMASIPMAFLSALLLWGCGDDPSCVSACENLDACGHLSVSRSRCVDECRGDPTVLEGDIKCLADSTCEEIPSCLSDASTRTLCWDMCSHIYENCRSRVRGADGAAMSQEQCYSFCRTDLAKEAAECLVGSSCSGLSSCFKADTRSGTSGGA